MIVNCKDILEDAYKGGYAIGSYNVHNLEWAKYILEASKEDRSQVIMAFSEKSVSYMGGYSVCVNLIKSLCFELKINIPVVIHLDHATSFESCKKAIDSGFTSVMIDASNLDLEDNIKITNKVLEYASERKVTVEAEIGKIGDSKEYDTIPIEEISEFYLRTSVDMLAISIGNKHGFYEEDDKLDFELLGSAAKEVRIPLVLHGASFLDDNKIKTAIFCGVSKININTELMYNWALSVRDYLNQNDKVYDPRSIISSGEHIIKRMVHEKNKLFGSKNRAN